jgi:hypothetical protein
LRRFTRKCPFCIGRNILGGEQAGFGGRNQYHHPATGGRRAKIRPTPFDSLLPPGAAVGASLFHRCAFFHARLCFATRLQGRASRIQVPRVTEQARIPFHVKHAGIRSVITARRWLAVETTARLKHSACMASLPHPLCWPRDEDPSRAFPAPTVTRLTVS